MGYIQYIPKMAKQKLSNKGTRNKKGEGRFGQQRKNKTLRQIIPIFDMHSTVTCHPACKEPSVAGVGFGFARVFSGKESRVRLIDEDRTFGFYPWISKPVRPF